MVELAAIFLVFGTGLLFRGVCRVAVKAVDEAGAPGDRRR